MNVYFKRYRHRTLAIIVKLVSFNMRLPTECFFTNVISIKTLATMYKLVPCNMRLPTECFFYKHYRHKDIGHYVYAGVL
jgi:membrane protein CcdC involved in cytochrome C biogenesis